MASVNMLTKLDLPSLEKLREMMKMIMMYCIVNDLVKLDHSNIVPTIVQTRSHNFRFKQPYVRTDLYLHSFYLLPIKLWNKLPPNTIQSNTITIFKQHLLK